MIKKWLAGMIAVLILPFSGFAMAGSAESVRTNTAANERLSTSAYSNLATTSSISANSSNGGSTANKVIDGLTTQTGYWESGSKPTESSPSWLTAKLASKSQIYRVEIALPGHWPGRTQNIRVLLSDDGVDFRELVARQDYIFAASPDNQRVLFQSETPVMASYVKIEIYSNTGGNGQIGELYIHGVALENLASASVVSADSTYSSFIAANAVDGKAATFWTANNTPTDTAPNWLTAQLNSSSDIYSIDIALPSSWGNRTQSIQVLVSDDGVRFREISARQDYIFESGINRCTLFQSVTPVTASYIRIAFYSNTDGGKGQIGELTIDGISLHQPVIVSSELAMNKPLTTSSTSYGKTENINDGSISTFWNGGASGLPTSVVVDLERPYTLAQVVLMLPSASNWADRNQEIEILISDDNESFSSVVVKTKYLFSFSKNKNKVTIDLPDGVVGRYLCVKGYSNDNGTQDGMQLSELQVYGFFTPVTGVTLTPSQCQMRMGGTHALTAAISPAEAEYTALEWSSSDNVVATVDENGVVTAHTSGECVITVRTLEGDYTDTCVITVSEGITVQVVGRYGELLYNGDVFTAAELIELSKTWKAPALGGYRFVGWTEPVNEDTFNIIYDTPDRVLTLNPIYKVDETGEKYTLSVTNASAADGNGDAITSGTFDQRVVVTGANTSKTVSYWILDGAKVGFGQNTYTFYISGNNQIQAIYDDATSIPIGVTLQQATLSGNEDFYNLSVIAQTSVTQENMDRVTAFGVCYTYSASVLKALEEDQFSVPASDYVMVNSSKSVNQQYMTHLVNVTPNKIRYARAYVVVDDQIFWSDAVVQFKTTPGSETVTKGSITS